MTNEFIEELEKIADRLTSIVIGKPRYYLNSSNLSHIRAEVMKLNDLIRKINEELN